MAEWLIALGLTLGWHRPEREQVDDSDWFAFLVFCLLVPLVVAVLMPYILWVALKDAGVEAVSRFSAVGTAVTLVAGLGASGGVLWGLLLAALLGLAGLTGISVRARRDLLREQRERAAEADTTAQ